MSTVVLVVASGGCACRRSPSKCRPGTVVKFKVTAAALREIALELHVRVVSVTDLIVLRPSGSHLHALSDTDFENLLAEDKGVVINYRDCSHDVAGLVFGYGGAERMMHIEGYREERGTTPPSV